MRGLLVLYFAAFLGHLVASLVGLISTFLVRDLMAVGYRDIDTVFDWYLVTDGVWHLSLMLFLHIITVLICVVLAGGPIRNPFLIIASSLPVVLAVLLVAGAALRLCVGLILRSELIVALLLVVGGALQFTGCLANLSAGGAALLLVQGFALVHIHSGTDVFLGLHIGGVPDGGLLCPAPH
jgi:hypothetical protein